MLIDDLRAFARENPTAAIICNDAANVLTSLYAKSANQAKALSEAEVQVDDRRRLMLAQEDTYTKMKARALAAEARIAEAEKERDDAVEQTNNLKIEVHVSFGKWSKALSWGLTGFQPECWAMMDMAVDELVRSRALIAEAMKVIEQLTPGHRAPGCWCGYGRDIDRSGHEIACTAARSFLNAQEKA